MERAIGKLDEGTYGPCETCGRRDQPGPPRGEARGPLLHRLRLETLTEWAPDGLRAPSGAEAAPGPPVADAHRHRGDHRGGHPRPPDTRSTSARPTVVFFLAIIPSIILHEVTHGWVALDSATTPRSRRGAFSLNPLVHVSLFGTLILPALLVLVGLSAVRMGEAGAGEHLAPAGTRETTCRRRARRTADEHRAGGGVRACVQGGGSHDRQGQFLFYGGSSLGVGQPVWAQYLFIVRIRERDFRGFNLIPIPPLDGASVLERLLPNRWLPGYLSIRPVHDLPAVPHHLDPSAMDGRHLSPVPQLLGAPRIDTGHVTSPAT